VTLRIALYTREMKKIIALALMIALFSSNISFASSKVTVFAASSLTESYTELGRRFEKAHPGVRITYSFQASSTLLTQIKSGAPADIFISAEPFPGGRDYLVNRLVLAVPRGSFIKKISDLNSKEVMWIQCALEVPCGSVSEAALSGENVTSKPVSLEPKASSVLAKLLAGEVDAAIVYRTDVLANKNLRAIEFKNLQAASTTYQIAQLKKNRWANTFMNFINSRSAINYLQSKGFDSK